MACSFQKEESVLLDMLMAIEPAARVFTLDTHVLFDETRAAWRAFEARWGVRVEVVDVLDPTGEPWSREHCCTGGGGQGRRSAERARRGRGLDHRSAPRAVADPDALRKNRMGRAQRPVEAQPPRRLERAPALGLHRRARPPLQRPPRRRVRLDRLRPVHAPRGRARGPLGREREDRVRPPRRGLTWTR